MRNLNACVPDPNKIVSCPGDSKKIIYHVKLDEKGDVVLTPKGEEDIQAQIDSWREQTDIAYVLKQLMLGDTSVLSDRQAMYGDFTVMPKDMREAMQMMLDAEAAFYKLDLDTRQKFDNNYKNWLINAGSDGWLQKMGLVMPTVEVEREVNNESSDA